MAERVTRSAAGSPLPRWGRRLLLVTAAGTGVWLLGCLGHHASAQAETASTRPIAPLIATGSVPRSAPVLPVKSAARASAERAPVTGIRLDSATRGGPVPNVPVLPLPSVLRSVPAAVPTGLLPPPARRSEIGAMPGSGGQQLPDASAPGSPPSQPRMVVPGLAVAAPVSAIVVTIGTEPAPLPQPVPAPGPGVPLLPGGDAGQSPGNPHSLPLGEPVLGPALGPAAGLASSRAADAADVRRQAYLPDTPPG